MRLITILLTLILWSFDAHVANADSSFPRITGKSLIDSGWRFSLDADSTASRPEYDDSGWRTLNLPHDWSVELDFDRHAPAGNDGAYLPTGIGWYRKTVDISDPSRAELFFEGVYMDSEVYVNGHLAGGHPYGYSSFTVDISPYARTGQNLIVVKVDNSKQKNSRWYTGSGIYRHVWLQEHPELWVDPQSVAVTAHPVKADKSWVNVDVDFAIRDAKPYDVISPGKFVVTLKSLEGEPFGNQVVALQWGGKTLHKEHCSLLVRNPRLWSPDHPELYTLEIRLFPDDNNPGTSYVFEDLVGLRTFTFNAEEGLRLNGEPIELNGGCVHHDNGILGAASYDAAEVRKAKLMKEAGFNAVRTSHNPPSPAFLYACDSLGLIVIDEAFDGWRERKTDQDYATLFDQWALKDVEAMVRRDRRHPSVFCWSIGNEIIERKEPSAVATARMLASKCRALDPSRPVTSALAAWDSDWEIYDPLAAQHDIVGYNYMIHKAESDHERVPDRVMWQTESYPRDAFSNRRMVADHPYIIGDFVWTAIDYLGESGIGRWFYEGQTEGEHFHRDQWPWHGAYCGDIDLTGLRKPISHYREMLWNPQRKLYMAVREPNGYNGNIKETMWGTYPTWESWNWRGHEGKPVEVEVISRYPRVRLYLDDGLIGEKAIDPQGDMKAVFEVPYREGTLKAVGVDADGIEAEETHIATAGGSEAVRLTSRRYHGGGGVDEIIYVIAELVDADGNVVPDADMELDFTVEGDGEVLATGSSCLTDMRRYSSLSRATWKGRALAVVKKKIGNNKTILTVGNGSLKNTIEL